MLGKRFTIDTCAADLQTAQQMFDHLANSQNASQDQIEKAAFQAKKLELRLASAKLAQAEYYLASLTARIDFLEARCAQEHSVTRTEREELAWAREALPINSVTVSRLATDLEKRRRELDQLQKRSGLI